MYLKSYRKLKVSILPVNRSYDILPNGQGKSMKILRKPCKSCDEKHKDLGGCRCQAYMLTGDATNADPVCDKSEFHKKLHNDVERIGKLAANEKFESKPLVFRNMRNSKDLTNNSKKTPETI